MINTNALEEIKSATEQIDPWTSEAYGQQVFDLAPFGVALASLDGQFVRVNATLCRMMNYTREELLACKLNDIIFPNDLPHNLVLFKRLRAGEIAHYQIDTRLIHKAGALIFAILYVELICDVHERLRHATIH